MSTKKIVPPRNKSRARGVSDLIVKLIALLALAPTFINGCQTSPKSETQSSSNPALSVSSSIPSSPTLPNSASAEPRTLKSCGTGPISTELAPGLWLERFHAPIPPPLDIGDRCITLVRIDPQRYQFRLVSALPSGQNRPASQWLDEFKLTGVINASMYHENQQSIGLMIDGARANNPDDNEQLGGIFAFNPSDNKEKPIAFFGKSCPGYDLAQIKKRYKTLIQNYRLLDCEGRAIAWKDPKSFSAAAIGQDRQGRMVFIHARTPYTMSIFSNLLALPALDLKDAHYVEGGPEASLYVRAGKHVVREIGSFETTFRPDDKNSEFWPIPNMIGFYPNSAPH